MHDFLLFTIVMTHALHSLFVCELPSIFFFFSSQSVSSLALHFSFSIAMLSRYVSLLFLVGLSTLVTYTLPNTPYFVNVAGVTIESELLAQAR